MTEDLPSSVSRLIRQVKEVAEFHRIDVRLVKDNHVKMGTLKVNGYFDSTQRVLAVALGKKEKPLDQWLSTFIHESCHMDQAIEGCKVWKTKVRGCDPGYIFDIWMNEVIELKPIPLHQMMMGVLNIELDCEKRSARKIKKYKVPIDVETYIQKANSYVYFYHMVAMRREWYHIGTEPYNIPEVWQAMPKTFDNDYTTLPAELKKLYVTHCFKGQPR